MDGALWFDAAAQGDATYIENNLNAFKCFQNERGDTALMLAVAAGQNHLIPILLPAEQGKKNEHGQTALIIAAIAGNVDAARYLAFWESGNTTTTGKTALSIACNRGFPEIVELLFPYEACIKYKDALPENEALQRLQEGEQFGRCVAVAQRYRGNELWPMLEVQIRRADQFEFELLALKNEVYRLRFGGVQSGFEDRKDGKHNKDKADRAASAAEVNEMKAQLAQLNEYFQYVQKAVTGIRNKPKLAASLGERITATEGRLEEVVGAVNVVIYDIQDFHRALGMVQKVIYQLSTEILKFSQTE